MFAPLHRITTHRAPNNNNTEHPKHLRTPKPTSSETGLLFHQHQGSQAHVQCPCCWTGLCSAATLVTRVHSQEPSSLSGHLEDCQKSPGFPAQDPMASMAFLQCWGGVQEELGRVEQVGENNRNRQIYFFTMQRNILDCLWDRGEKTLAGQSS